MKIGVGQALRPPSQRLPPPTRGRWAGQDPPGLAPGVNEAGSGWALRPLADHFHADQFLCGCFAGQHSVACPLIIGMNEPIDKARVD